MTQGNLFADKPKQPRKPRVFRYRSPMGTTWARTLEQCGDPKMQEYIEVVW
jgi:hypothetical protein